MSHFDHLNIDGHLLNTLVAVVEAGSVTGAAQRLGVTQSAVSHLLDKLRQITGDPLFVKSGRGIVATACAEGLGGRPDAGSGGLGRKVSMRLNVGAKAACRHALFGEQAAVAAAAVARAPPAAAGFLNRVAASPSH